MKINISVVIPVYNEEKILEKSMREFVKYLTLQRKIGKFEIILAENGSTDETYKIAQRFTGPAAKVSQTHLQNQPLRLRSEASRPVKMMFGIPLSRHPLKYENKWNLGNNKVKLIRIGEKSLGKALSQGIMEASYENIYFDAIDNPFDFMDLEKFLEKISSNDLIFASKNHPKSVYKSKISRIIASKTLFFLNRLLFAIPISDTQGTFMGKREKLVKILPFCKAKGAFFQIQLAIYAIRGKLKVDEVPVEFISSGKRSNFSLVKDGLVLIGDLVKEKIKLLGY